MDTMIEARGLTRRFGRAGAVNEFSLRVPEGGIFALLGPNGAGKSTVIKLLMNIIAPSAGSSSVLGVDSRRLGPEAFSRIGYVAEDQQLPDWMTVAQFLDYVKPFYPTWDDALCKRLLKQYELPLDRRLKHLSHGMRMKAALLSSLAYRPPLLVLDEPFTGLDPLVRDEFIDGILELTEQECWTVFLASHDLDEVERLADRVGIILEGRLREDEPVDMLQARFRQVQVAFAAERDIPDVLPTAWLLPEKAGGMLRFVDSRFDAAAGEVPIRAALPACGVIVTTAMSLRDIFVTLSKTYRAHSGREMEK